MSDPDTIDSEAKGDAETVPSAAQLSIDRIASFLFVTGASLLFLSAFLLTVRGVEKLLQLHFERVVNDSIQVAASPRPPGEAIGENLNDSVESSRWVRTWGVKVNVIVTARDGRTWLYVNGRPSRQRYRNRDPRVLTEIHARLLPATATVRTSVEHNTALFVSILIVYATIFLTGFFVYNRRVVDRQIRLIDNARESRDQAAGAATRIQKELEAVRSQLREIEPAARKDRDEIARLQSEQQQLRSRLESLAARERELRGQAERAAVLEEDSRVLEGMLEEATADLAAKDTEIRELEQSLKRTEKRTTSAGRKPKASEVLAKRIRTLYPQLDIDDRAVDDIAALPDEATRLRAEECIKRLAEDADNLGFRRKVKALPNHASIYELAFAGKRRVYYAKVGNGRFRILVVGDKKTQRSDLDYLSKIPREELLS